MPDKPNDADVLIGAWNQELALDSTKRKVLNRPGLDLTKDQMRQLYARLYPMIESDFKHRDDIFQFMIDLLAELEKQRQDTNNQLSTLKREFDSHFHVGNLGSPTSKPTIPITGVVITQIANLKTEDSSYIIESNGHVREFNLDDNNYLLRDTVANKNVKKSGNSKLIEELLTKDAKIYVPFDVGEEDSILKSDGSAPEKRTLADI